MKNSAWVAQVDDATLAVLDVENRCHALDLTTSFIVQAPAGAGKTELLTQRFLGLLATVEAPEQIVAITFTRKAAAEMKARILSRLSEVDDTEPAEEHKKVSWRLARAAATHATAQGWSLRDTPERLRVTTIDALCASLVRQMPYLSRFGGMPRIADRPELHYEEAARRTVAAVEDLPAVARALASLDNDGLRLRRLLVTMLSFREQWLPHVQDLRGGDAIARARLGAELTANLERLVARDLAAVAAAFIGRQSEALMAAARFVAATQADYAVLSEWQAPLAATPDSASRWQALAALLLTGTGTPRKKYDARIGLPAGDATAKAHAAELKVVTTWLEDDAAALAALQAAARCPLPRYAAADLDAIETFAEVLVLAAANLWLVFQESGETDFSAIAERALEALGAEEAPTDLAQRLDYAISHLLVDEFQDTNPQQIALLEKLTAGWQVGDGRSLFVVGDPMQSIYRFRKADVGLFLRAWERGIGSVVLEPLTLYRNNRSTPAVVDWVNATFAGVFPVVPDAEQGRVAYTSAITTRATRPEDAGGVTVHPILVPKDAEDGGTQEAAAILRIIEETRRMRPAADIAVLVRARDHLAPLVDALRRERPDIRYEAVEIESLADRQPIQDLLALTHALDHRADRVNWLAILRAPWCGLTLDDLHALAAAKKVGAGRTATERTLWSLMNDDAHCATLTPDGLARLAHLCDALRPLMEAPGCLGLRRTVESAWRRLGGDRCLSSASDRTDIAAFFALLDRLAAGRRVDMARLDEEVKRLYAAPSSDPQAGQLKFMTIHKSKGLEFDTVILPGLHRRSGRNDTRLLSWDSAQDEFGHHRLVVAPCRLVDDDDDTPEEANDIRGYIEKMETARADQEMRRLLYVAATRAKRCLHLLAVQSPKREATGLVLAEPKKREGTSFNILWLALRESFQSALAQFDAPAAEDAPPMLGLADFVPCLQRLPRAALPALTTTVVVPAGEETIAAESGIFHGSSLAPLVGILVHRYLELIASEGVAHWDAARIAACRPACEKWLRGRGCDTATSRRGAERTLHALAQAVTSERGRWILHGRADAACELALTQHAADALRNHVIDRSFVEDGVRWIIDYKTGAHEGGDVEAFVAARRAEYAPQLARYAELFAGAPLRLALYFVDLDRFEELT